MGVILEGANGEELAVNWWNWRPTVALLGRWDVLPPGERTERCLGNGCGGHLSADEALAAADHLDELLTTLSRNERVLMAGERSSRERRTLDVSVTEWTDDDVREVYGAHHDWLTKLAAFCRRSGGFTVL